MVEVDGVVGAIADPARRSILVMLRERPLSAGQIAERFTISRPAVSRHLRVLRESGLVRGTLVGRNRVYELDASRLAGLIEWLAHFTQGEARAAQGEALTAQHEARAAQNEAPVAQGEDGVAQGEDGVAQGEDGVAQGEDGAVQHEGWERRFDALETEVYRTRRERRIRGVTDRRKERPA